MTNSDSKRIGIIGAGMLGLTLAKELAKKGHNVTIIEASSEIGGQASTWQLGPITWDRHYHIIAPDDHHLLDLIKELKLNNKLHMYPTQTGFLSEGKLYSLSSISEFLKFPVISFYDKTRLAITLLRASTIKNTKKHENTTALMWLTRWSGKNTTEKLWSPLLKSKFGEKYHELSASFIVSTIKRMFGARKASGKQELFGYISGGYKTILSAIREFLEEHGVEIVLGSPVQSILKKEDFIVSCETRNYHFDQVFITTAAPLVPKLCPQLSLQEKDRLESVEYLGIVCASLLLTQPLSNYYITNILDRWIPFTGIIEMSALVKKSEFEDFSLVYLPRYVPSESTELLPKDEETFKTETLNILTEIYPDFHTDNVKDFRVSRVKYILALPTKKLQKNPLPFTTSIPELYTINTAHITDGVLTVNKIIALAKQALSLYSAPAP